MSRAVGPLTLGTAGHIDHGKTTLIRALTGVDTDRLPEERARGISIELGYASLGLPSGRRVSIVDVPGHERFVRTMVAGATGIDLYLMTVAADDGVMPQTLEHAAVLRGLGVDTGVVAVTKSDLADPALALLEAAELLPGAEAVAVSALSGEGLEELLGALDRAAARVPSRAQASGPPRLHIDRVFTIRGAGTVVTGTLWSGSVARGDELTLLGGARRQLRVRVRGVQVHDAPVQQAAAGQRVAVNVTGVAVGEVARGDLLTAGDAGLRPTFLIDAQLWFDGDEELEGGARVQVHHGTRESAARIAWLGGAFWQVRLEQPLLPLYGDRLVIRRIAPPDTLGGGVVLDAHPRKHGPSREALTRLERLARGESPIPETPVSPEPEPEPEAEAERDREPARPESPPPLTPEERALEERLRDAGIEPPAAADLDERVLRSLSDAGRAVRVSKALYYHPDALDSIRRRLIGLAQRHDGVVTLAQLRDELGTSRKFAQALLEHFDNERVTIRHGDEHRLRRGVT